MELYEFNDERTKLLVYELQGIKEEIRKYKEEHLRRRFYDLETVNKDLIDCLLNGEAIDEWRLKSKNKDLHANLIISSSETEYQKVVRDSLLIKYYNDNYERVYSHTDDITWYRFPNLLVLHNKDLVGLHLLEQGNYRAIVLDNILSKETPFYLFDLMFKKDYNCSMGVLDLPIMKKTKENIECSSKVLALYRNSVKNNSI